MPNHKTPGHQWAPLQAGFLAAMHGQGPFDLDSGTIVVVPSLTLQADELKELAGVQFYEERLLFLLLLLSRPGVRLVFITSSAVAPEIIDYHLEFLPDPKSARERLTLVPLHDARQLPLTTKILVHPEVISRLRDLAQDLGNAYLLAYNVTPEEEQLAARIGLPIYGPPAHVAHLGEKTGGRAVARAAGVPVVDGIEDLHTAEDVKVAFARLCRPGAHQAVLKLNDSFSGMGNLILSRRPAAGAVPVAAALWAMLPKGVVSWEDYLRRLLLRGGIMEQMVPGPLTAPSVQLLIKPGRDTEVVSTHNQILGGLADQIYLGCEFPADQSYRDTIVKYARQIAAVLAEREVVGMFAVDFLVAQAQDQVYFCEINLRLGGTTHPFGICSYLTRSRYEPRTGLLMSPLGPRCYVASDNVQDDLLIGRSPATVIKAMSEAGVLFDESSLVGVTLHQLGSLADSGKLGMCSIAASREAARSGFQKALGELLRA